MISSEGTTPLILFPSLFTKVRFHQGKFSMVFKRCCQTRPSIQAVFPVILHSSRFPSLAIKQMFKMSQNSPASLLHSSFMIIFASWWWPAARQERRESGWIAWDLRLPPSWKVTVTARAVREACGVQACLQLLSVKGRLSLEADWLQGQRLILCWVRHPGRGVYCETPRNLVTAALWDRIRGGKRWKILGTTRVVMILCYKKFSS